MSDPLAVAQKVLGAIANSKTREADMLLLQVPPEAGRLLRLCAIPHSFDAEILGVVDPGVGAEEAARLIEEFRPLPAVMELPGCLALHDIVRIQLFRQWLTPERRPQFAEVSRRLAAHFEHRAFKPGPNAEAAERARIFHLIGAEPERGFADFLRVYAERRARRVQR